MPPICIIKLEHLLDRSARESACLKLIRVSTRTIRLFLSLPSFVLHRLFMSLLHTLYFISTMFPTPLARPFVRCHTQLIFLLSFCAIVFSLCYIIHAYMTYLLPLCFASCVGEKLAPFLKNRCLLIAWQVRSFFFFYLSNSFFTLGILHTHLPFTQIHTSSFFIYPSIFSYPYSATCTPYIFMVFSFLHFMFPK